nr:uncharacterized protein LOC106691631 [Halyomorpha halys]
MIKNWHVSDEESCSDHRYIRYDLTICDMTELVSRNPKLTNWDTYCTQLEEEVKSCPGTIRNTWQLECLNTSLTVIKSHSDNNRICRIQTNRNTTWWNEELARLRGLTRRLFNTAKRTGCWNTYKSALTDYNRMFRKAKRGAWRRFCNDVNDAPTTFRINRILSRDSVRGVLGAVEVEGGFTNSEAGTLEALAR